MRTFGAWTGLSLMALLSLATVSNQAFAEPPIGPSPDDFFIEQVTYNGSGCAYGGADVQLEATENSFTLYFGKFTAQVGPGFSLADSRKNCQVNLTMHVPEGYTYAISSIEQHGYAQLTAGARALLRTSFYYSGQAATSSVTRVIGSPLHDSWDNVEEIEEEALLWAPCDVKRNLNINTSLRVSHGTSAPETSSYITMDSESFDQSYHLVFKRCE